LFIDRRLSERKVQMLRNLGIRWQILSALALPVLVLGLISSQVTYQALVDMRAASQSRELAQAGNGFAVLIDALGNERALTEQMLLGVPGAQAKVKAARVTVDSQLTVIRHQVYEGNTPNNTAVQQVLARLASEHALIPAIRSDADGGKVAARAIIARYSLVIQADVQVPFDLGATISDQDQAANFRAFGNLGTAIEALAEEQLTGAAAITSGKPSTTDQRDLGSAEATNGEALDSFLRTAPAAQQLALSTALAKPAARTSALAAARTALESAGTSQRPSVSLADWTAVTTAQINAIRTVATGVSQDGVALADSDYHSARTKLQLTLAGAIGIFLLTLLLAYGLSRRISAPLRRLTQAATQIRDELPRLVESLQSDDSDEVQLPMPVVSTVGRNEVSQLAAAFVDVNAVTVEIAREQARLRAAIGDMFVNVARRNQVLLSRQLAFIDQLERNEVNPDALEELFRLDHLATRMRRNAESLLVLAGIESGRRLREPMPLSDVVRTATSEIEHYSRVSISLSVDPPIFAHLALPVAHLLAELLENATNFSDPGSTVVVMANLTDYGLQLTIADDGLGMSDEELLEINARIDEPPTAEALSSQRLGFFVVGRLAQRLEAKVKLTSGRSRGTAVLIDLPADLFIPGAIGDPGYDQPAAIEPAQSAQPAPSAPAIPSQTRPGFPVRTPEPAGALAGGPFADAYGAGGADPTAGPGFSPAAALLPAPPVLPPSFDTTALNAEAEAAPTWTPQPDAQPSGAVVQPAIVPGAPLARRGVSPIVAAPIEVAPIEPVSAASEWATPDALATTRAREALEPGSAGPTPPVAGTSLFSGFRSRREAVPAAPPAPVEPVAAEPIAAEPIAAEPYAAEPVAEPVTSSWSETSPFAETSPSPDTSAGVGTTSFAESPSFAETSPFAATAETNDEWFNAGAATPAPENDQWQTWAEVSAANASPADPADQADQAGPSGSADPSVIAGIELSPTWDPNGNGFAPEAPAASPAETPVAEFQPEPAPWAPAPAAAVVPEPWAPEPAAQPMAWAPEPVVPAPWTPEPASVAPEPAPVADSTPEPWTPQEAPAVWTPNAVEPAAWRPAPQPQAQTEPAPTPYVLEPAAYQPEAYQPEPAAPEAYPAEAYQPEPYQPEPYQPEVAEPEYQPSGYEAATYQPALYQPETFDPAESAEAAEPAEPEVEAAPVPRAPGDELRMRTLTAAIDILPQRTTIRTALRRGGRRKTDTTVNNLPFNGGFDPIEPAREFARREGFMDSSSSTSPVSTGLPAELNGIPSPGGPIPAQVDPSRPWEAAGAKSDRRQNPRTNDPAADQAGRGGRSALASEALTELSRLSSYSPTSMPSESSPALQRRPPSEMALDDPNLADQPVSQRARTAASVRSMLAGFKAGVERGRTSPSANRPVENREAGALPQPRNPSGRDE
jgi:signal transduction histidine kinase